jgi:hypothetical protein
MEWNLVFEPRPEVLEFEKNVTKPKPQSFEMGRIGLKSAFEKPPIFLKKNWN